MILVVVKKARLKIEGTTKPPLQRAGVVPFLLHFRRERSKQNGT